MNTTELEQAIRETATIGDVAAYPDYSQARILREANNKLTTVFEDPVTKARSGYWLHDFIFTATVGRNRYRIPPRAVVGGLESVAVTTSVGAPFYELDQIPPSDIQDYEGQPGRSGQPLVYVVSGDQIELVPTPNVAIQVRFQYYIRPSVMYPAQSGVGNTTRGLITAVNVPARQVTVAVLPFDMSLASPTSIIGGAICDIVHPDGWHELSMVNVAQNSAGGGPFVVTLGGTDDMSDVQIGDYLRAADQTDWPCLPDDFHRCLCDSTAVKLLIELHLGEKAALLAGNNASDLQRFRNLLYPRVKAAPKQVGIMRRSRGNYPFGRFFG